MSNILFLANLNPNKLGSMEEQALYLGAELAKRGHNFILGCVADPAPQVDAQLSSIGIKWLKIPCEDTNFSFKRLPALIGRMFDLLNKIKENQVNIVHINFISVTNPNLLGLYLSGVKIIFTDHCSGGIPKRNPIKQFLSRILHLLVKSGVFRYIGVSDYVTRRLRVTHHLHDSNRLLTIYNGVNLTRFLPGNKEDARSRLGFAPDRPIVLAVAMLIPEKGLQVLLNAVSLLVRRKVPDLLLVVAGEGWFRTELERMLEKLDLVDHVMFLGRRNDVQSLIAAADVVAVPSIWEEAFGLIIAEAMASARPVVASRVGGIPELVEHNVTGLQVEPGDSSGLADAIEMLLADSVLQKRLADAALAKAGADFDLSRQVVKIADMYEEVLNQ